MSAPRQENPSPGAVRKRRYDEKQRDTIAAQAREIETLRCDLAAARRRLAEIERHWLCRWFV